MGAPESKIFRGFIPKEQLGEASSWEFASLDGAPVARPRQTLSTEREKRAFELGLVQGRTEGQAAERRIKAERGAQLAKVLGALRERFGELESGGADALLDLAFAIARQVLRREVTAQRDALLPVVREAVALVVDQHAHPRVFLNPQDLEFLRAELDGDGLFKGCRFVADARVARGGCRVETPHGEVDATLQTRWQRVLASLGAVAQDLPFAGPEDDAAPIAADDRATDRSAG